MRVRGILPFLLLSLVAGIVFGLVWVLADDVVPDGEAPRARPRPAAESLQGASPVEEVQSERNEREIGESASSKSSTETGRQATTEAASSESFFLPPKMDGAGAFILVAQPVNWSASCAKKSQLRSFADLKEYVRQTHPLVLTSIPPARSKTETGVNILHLNQFLRDKESREFLQYSIVQGADPALGSGYRIERYRFRDGEMNEILGSEVLIPSSKRFDLDGQRVRSEFQKIMDGLKPPRYLAGARILVYTASNLPTTGAAATRADKKPITATIELTNGVITGYSTQDMSCEAQLPVRADVSPTVCECLLSPENGRNAP